MNEPEAYEVATAFLAERGVSFSRCYSKRVLDSSQIEATCGGEFGILPGSPRRVWAFNFLFEEVPPDVAVCGNHCIVYVDDDTRQCGYFGAM